MPSNSRRSASKNSAAAGRLDAVLAAGLLALCAVVVAALAWTQPDRSTLVLSYAQHGQATYSAPTGALSPYGIRGVRSGQPVYADVVPELTVGYGYLVSASRPVEVIGSEQLMATVSDGLGATQTIALQPKAVNFAGQNFLAHGNLDMRQLSATVANLAKSAGANAPTHYTVSVSPSVSARGRLGGQPFTLAFDRPLDFSYAPASSSAPATLTPPGSDQTGPAAGAGTSTPSTASLSTVATGSVQISGGAPNKLFFGVNVTVARIASLALLAASLLLIWLIGRPLLADANSTDERLRIATRHGSSLVEVDALPSSSRTAVVDLHSFEGLLRVSRRLECPVLHCLNNGVYAVVDNGTMYRYSCAQHEESACHASTNGHKVPPVSLPAPLGGTLR